MTLEHILFFLDLVEGFQFGTHCTFLYYLNKFFLVHFYEYVTLWHRTLIAEKAPTPPSPFRRQKAQPFEG